MPDQLILKQVLEDDILRIQEIPEVTGKFDLGYKMKQGKGNRVLPRQCTAHSKHSLPTTQEMTLHMDIIRWWVPKLDWLYYLQPNMEKLYTVSKHKAGSWLWHKSTAPYCKIQAEIEESRENH